MLSENKINHFFFLAKNACLYSDNKKTRVGCIIVYKNSVISVGYNKNSKTHPLQKKYNNYRGFDTNASKCNNSLHAECAALSKIKYYDIDWKKVNVFVYRIRKDGTKGMAKPCQACEELIKDMGIKNVYYSTDIGWNYERYD